MAQPSTTSLPPAKKKLTPAMQQWATQKSQVPDAILLFRMGDFYETFHEDAQRASQILGITLTTRDRDVPLAGIPYHALEGYLAKLVAAGCTVAISEQVEDPKKAKGVVKRDIVRIVTPGTLTEDSLLPGNTTNYLAAVHANKDGMGASCVDLATGDFFTIECADQLLVSELARLQPAELLVTEAYTKGIGKVIEQLQQAHALKITTRSPHEFESFHAERTLHSHFGVTTMDGFGFEGMSIGLCTAGALLSYLQETQRVTSGHLLSIYKRQSDRFVSIDPHSWAALEIEQTVRSGSHDGSLLAAINRTSNPMGSRRLQSSLRFPLRDVSEIRHRHVAIACLLERPALLEDMRKLLRSVGDIERITARIGVGRCSPRDLSGLGRSLGAVNALSTMVSGHDDLGFDDLSESATTLASLADYLSSALAEDAPTLLKDGGFVAPGFNAELDELREVAQHGKAWLAKYQTEESDRTQIPLKIGYNKVFGYYIEVTHAHRDRVPEHYIRKQTIKNAERFITEELKTFETKALTAKERSIELEVSLFQTITEHTQSFIPALLAAANTISHIDMICGFAVLAGERQYTCPEITDGEGLEIIDGRHPVLDLDNPQDFVPNDTEMSANDAQVLIITGPNMAGKSTYIRQVALLTLLAQTGSYVPAKTMRFGLVDRIFARIGASDEISRGQSTFMVEMVEAANILNNATSRSLVVLDELGRGTSTYDGLSLAWAICEHLATHTKCRTLFATHYHELTELAKTLPAVRNYNVAVREWPDDDGEHKIIFLHKIIEGGSDKSYGVHVAKIAGIPQTIIQRSNEVLCHLESGLSRQSLRKVIKGESPFEQLELFETQNDLLRQNLIELKIEEMTPMQAMQALKDLQDEAR